MNALRHTHFSSRDEAEANDLVQAATRRGIIEIRAGRITYILGNRRAEDWNDPEEWVRCYLIAFLILEKDYPANRIRTEVVVPRRTPNDSADVVVYADDACREPFLVVEAKRSGIGEGTWNQAIEQAFGNANSLRAPWALVDSGDRSILFDVGGFPAMEREENQRGPRDVLTAQYGSQPQYAYVVGSPNDIAPARRAVIETRIRNAHSRIWSGGKRDPLRSFDEWSKLLFAKVQDERWTPNGQIRQFQVGTDETVAAVANRVHRLFDSAKEQDPAIFDEGVRINLPDRKIVEVVRALQGISFVDTDVDNIGAAFEDFFGSVFRGELGQYFTMRQISRFTVGMLGITHEDYVLDPTAGSGGFLLEVLLQVWHQIDNAFPAARRSRLKNDFALNHVYGIEIHDVLARICKINLLLHHDGHTNIEADKSCLDSTFSKPRLNPPRGQFTKIVGNPPFGDEVKAGDEDLLGENSLQNFVLGEGKDSVQSEHIITERCIDLLAPGGRMGLVLPDGILNNAGEISGCPQVRRLLVSKGRIEAIVSLPDYAFRRSGAQNKTSILFFRKYTTQEQNRAERILGDEALGDTNARIQTLLQELRYRIFIAEAARVGYSSTGAPSAANDMYSGTAGGRLEENQGGTILGEYRRFIENEDQYQGRTGPDCMALDAAVMWAAHGSNRLDPKYHLFKRDESTAIPNDWIRMPLGAVMRRREDVIRPEERPDELVRVLTISQTGEIREREAGKGRNPPEWRGMYFQDIPSRWYAARSGDVVFSSIDLWKGCISIVSPEFDRGLVTKEFPIYEVTDNRLSTEFLWGLLRSRHYQRAFRAITTGHSNRRRTQQEDFEALEVAFPAEIETQMQMVRTIFERRQDLAEAGQGLRLAFLEFSDRIDGRAGEELPEIAASEAQEDSD